MRRILAGVMIGLALLLGGAGAYAASYMPKEMGLKHFLEVGFPSKGNHKVSGGSSYSGPGDQGITLTDCWGAQLCTNSYSGHAAIVCNVATFTNCNTIDYTANGDLNTTQLAAGPASCSGDTTCVVKQFYSNYNTGCNQAYSAAADSPFVLMTSTANGHVSVGQGSHTNTFLSCIAGSTISDATLLQIASIAANNSNYGFFGIYNGGSDTLSFLFDQGGSNGEMRARWVDDGNTNHDSGLLAFTPTPGYGVLFSVAAQTVGSNTSALSQLILAQTASTATTTTGAFTRSSNSQISFVGTLSGAVAGNFPTGAYITPHTTNGNAITVLQNMCKFWTGSTSC